MCSLMPPPIPPPIAPAIAGLGTPPAAPRKLCQSECVCDPDTHTHTHTHSYTPKLRSHANKSIHTEERSVLESKKVRERR